MTDKTQHKTKQKTDQELTFTFEEVVAVSKIVLDVKGLKGRKRNHAAEVFTALGLFLKDYKLGCCDDETCERKEGIEALREAVGQIVGQYRAYRILNKISGKKYESAEEVIEALKEVTSVLDNGGGSKDTV